MKTTNEQVEQDALRVITSDKKYAIVLSADGVLSATRHDQFWRDCTGDKLVLTLAQDLSQSRAEITALRAKVAELDEQIQAAKVAFGFHPDQTCDLSLEISGLRDESRDNFHQYTKAVARAERAEAKVAELEGQRENWRVSSVAREAVARAEKAEARVSELETALFGPDVELEKWKARAERLETALRKCSTCLDEQYLAAIGQDESLPAEVSAALAGQPEATAQTTGEDITIGETTSGKLRITIEGVGGITIDHEWAARLRDRLSSLVAANGGDAK